MKKENPDFYKLNHKLAVEIWEALNQVDHPCLPNILSKTMIEQGCQEVELDDPSLILMFWKDYLENEGMISFTLENKIVH
jgi:hypothetical protein